MKKTAKILIVIQLLFLSLGLLPQPTAAAGASLYLSPSNGTKTSGDKFNIFVYVGASQAVNTFDVYLSSNNMTVLGVSSGGSICVLFPNPPSYTSSTARFKCGLPTPGFNGGKGYIGSIVVQAGSPGTGSVSIDSPSSVLANDGSGTNVLTSKGSATFAIQPHPTSAPTISSSTHPDESKWYKATTATLSWNGSGGAFSYILDQNPNTDADQKSEGSGKTKTYENLTEGTWYFHVNVQGSNGTWSPTSTFRLQIDTTPPEKFTPEADPKENAEVRPIIAFNTTDKTSGIDHYELKVDNGSWTRVDNPYKLASISSGSHTVYVKAVDKAGNETIGEVKITVKQIQAPKIILPTDGTTIPYGSDLLIKGQAGAGFTVKIYLDEKLIATVKADQNGNFSYTYKELIKSGRHRLFAVAINKDNIESSESNVVHFNLDPKAYLIFGFTIPGMSLLFSLVFLLVLLLIMAAFLLLGAKRFRRKLKKVLEELEEEVDKDLSSEKASEKLKKEVDEDFDEAEKKT
ncbi:MAG TPA: hypothetical protein VLE47_00715 [Candidatus Saccharimonadales bacterium]|nr:hypothetical protein [Candidatus Saccharimonadales bacterium]